MSHRRNHNCSICSQRRHTDGVAVHAETGCPYNHLPSPTLGAEAADEHVRVVRVKRKKKKKMKAGGPKKAKKRRRAVVHEAASDVPSLAQVVQDQSYLFPWGIIRPQGIGRPDHGNAAQSAWYAYVRNVVHGHRARLMSQARAFAAVLAATGSDTSNGGSADGGPEEGSGDVCNQTVDREDPGPGERAGGTNDGASKEDEVNSEANPMGGEPVCKTACLANAHPYHSRPLRRRGPPRPAPLEIGQQPQCEVSITGVCADSGQSPLKSKNQWQCQHKHRQVEAVKEPVCGRCEVALGGYNCKTCLKTMCAYCHGYCEMCANHFCVRHIRCHPCVTDYDDQCGVCDQPTYNKFKLAGPRCASEVDVLSNTECAHTGCGVKLCGRCLCECAYCKEWFCGGHSHYATHCCRDKWAAYGFVGTFARGLGDANDPESFWQ